jgi:hypothetical protein
MEYLSIITIFLGVGSNMAIGNLWYSNILFGKRWYQETGVPKLQGHELTQAILKNMLCAFIMSTGMFYFIHELNILTLWDSLKFALYAWLSFVVTTSLPGCFFAKKTSLTWIIDNSYYLIAMISISSIILLLKH